jgi:hypothetical protein
MFLVNMMHTRKSSKPCEASETLQLNALRRLLLTDFETGIKRNSIAYRLNNGSINVFTCSESALYVEDFLSEFGAHLGRVAGEDQFGNQYNVLNEGGAYGGTAFSWYAARYYDEETDEYVDSNIEISTVGLNDGVFNVSTTLRLYYRDDSNRDFCAGYIDYEKFSPEQGTGSDQPVLILHSCAVRPYA